MLKGEKISEYINEDLEISSDNSEGSDEETSDESNKSNEKTADEY